MLTICHNYFCITPNNKNGKETVQPTSKRKLVLGIFILLLVDVLWVVSSELTKYIYVEKKLEKPFLISYVRSSLLFIYLIVLCFTPPTKDPCRPSDYTQLLEPTTETDDENFYNEATNSLGDSTFVPVRAGETTDSDDATPRAVRFNKVAEVRVMSAAMAGEALLARLSWAASMRASEYAQRRAAAAATRRHLRLAFFVFLPWFVSNYLYRVSLTQSKTSTASVYASSAGALALATGALLAQAPSDRLTLPKGVAVLLTAASLVVLGIAEGHQSNWIAVVSALGAGFCYSIHILIFRYELRKGDGINCPLLVGLVGCLCGGVVWVIGGVLAGAGVERFELPPSALCSWVLLDAAIGPLLIESLWLWGSSLTSPWTATCVSSLALPAAACADVWRGGGPASAVAALLACAGWSAAALQAPARLQPLRWLRDRLRTSDRFTALRNIPDLDEQSEALMCSEEPS